MRAIVITRAGGPEVLRAETRPDPVPGPDEVRVRVRACGVNRADVLQRRGLYPAPAGADERVPGLEFAGTVERVGARVAAWRRGDRVMGILAGGGYAERVCVHERQCLEVPAAFDWPEAAAVPEAFLTAWDALVVQGELGAGERVLVHAAGSGVGTAAVQLALAAGARVVALSRSAEKRDRLTRLGAHAALDPADATTGDAIRLATGGTGIDLALDLVGAAAWPLHAAVLAERARVVVIGLLGGRRAEIDLGLVLRRRLTLRGSVLRSRPLEEKLALTRRFARRVLPLFAEGRLRPIVDRTLPLERAAEAHACMERNVNFGKIVLTVGDD